jgi:6-phospho-beta-glucosidase
MKLTVIGGGGVRAVFLAKGVAARRKESGIDTLMLYDIDERRLATIVPLCRHAALAVDPLLEVRFTSDLDEAIDGAEAFITTVRVGGDHSRVLDESIAMKHKLLPQETTGIGGFCMAMRTIPVLRGYCERIRAVAPNAWIFNFANPAGLVTQAMTSAGFDRVVGICDTPSSTGLRIAQALSLPVEELRFQWVGLNHLSWIVEIARGGTSLLDGLLRDDLFLSRVPEIAIFDPGLIRMLGAIPNEYLYYFYYRERAIESILRSGTTRGAFIEANNDALFSELSRIDIEKDAARGLAIYRSFLTRRESSYMAIESSLGGQQEWAGEGAGYSKVVLDFLAAIGGEQEREMVLNVPNHGAVPFLEQDDVLEITCRVSAKGLTRVSPRSIPRHARVLMTAVKLYERLAIAAAARRSRALAIESLMAHPLVGSYPTACEVMEECLDAFRPYVGDFP